MSRSSKRIEDEVISAWVRRSKHLRRGGRGRGALNYLIQYLPRRKRAVQFSSRYIYVCACIRLLCWFAESSAMIGEAGGGGGLKREYQTRTRSIEIYSGTRDSFIRYNGICRGTCTHVETRHDFARTRSSSLLPRNT